MCVFFCCVVVLSWFTVFGFDEHVDCVVCTIDIDCVDCVVIVVMN